MLIISDSPHFCRDYMHRFELQVADDIHFENKGISAVVDSLLEKNHISCVWSGDNFWNYLILTEIAECSQYDLLIDLCKKFDLPDKVLCIAGSGKKFHGFRKRPWVSLPGNIHLSVHLKPEQEIKNFATGLTILSAVSVLEAIDEIDELQGRAGFKWVNDIVIDHAKVSGVIAHSQVQAGEVTNAILGIGVNVESRPEVVKDSYIPEAACLNDFLKDKIEQSEFFPILIEKIEQNYNKLLAGKYSDLLNLYRERSVIIGKEVKIMTDPIDGKPEEMISGKVLSIGENLELFLDNQKARVVKGRLILF
jgi:BirA family transcriptional regulator, biotin operon repressor / biotin---[acetyl-CoA-carboxylase] ligase